MSNMAEADIRARSGGPVRDPARQRALERMAGRLPDVEGAPRPRQGFRVELLADRNVNAFVLPNGYSGYFDGMWGFVGGNPDEMAIIMGHEMGHLDTSDNRQCCSGRGC
jgi:predicted Zn-dependent protease